MLTIKNLTKRYDQHKAVSQLSVHIPRGQIWGFLGVNGAGKSTTMKMIAGLLKPTQGDIEVKGIDVLREPLKAKRIIGYVPDRPYLYERLSAAEYLYFVGKLYNISAQEMEERAERWLNEFELLDKRGHLIESFSHGMKQRLVMASVFLHQPELLIVDEPMVGLDPRGARRLKELLKRECKERGLTVLLSTHTLVDVEELCDQILLIHQGELLAKGTADELRSSEGEGLEDVFLRLTEGEPGGGS
jgi:ABC-2 type transport system ATP-binding protein